MRDLMPPMPDAAAPLNVNLLLLALFSIIGLVILVARFKFNAFIALMIASVVVGLGSGMQITQIASVFESGVGKTLGFLGMIIGLGTILGKLLAESGAAEVIASTLVRWLGVKRLDYAVMLMSFLVGISVFFGVGVILLGPIVFSLARETRTPILRLALPMAAGLSTAHGLIPPHPGPMAAIATLHANTGLTILWSVIFGLPVALLTGPLLARWVTPRVPVEMGGLGATASGGGSAPRRPSFGISVFTMLLPVILMLLATLAELTLPVGHGLRSWATFIGAPTVAMLVAVLFSFWSFGRSVGLPGERILKFTEECVGPAASIFLVVGAGGGFSTILNASGVGKEIAALASQAPVSPLVLGWLIAGLLRIAVGSATVAVTMAAGLMLPLVESTPGINLELLVLSMGAGSLILSHVNDSGFWFVKEYIGMSVTQTLKTWTVVETGIAVSALILILLADWILRLVQGPGGI